jgi:hypothetical protein
MASRRALVPTRRLRDLAHWGLPATAPRPSRSARRIATLVATLAHLQATSIDGCLELFDVIMTTDLLAKAERETNKQRGRTGTRDSLAPRRSSRACSASCSRRPAPRDIAGL